MGTGTAALPSYAMGAVDKASGALHVHGRKFLALLLVVSIVLNLTFSVQLYGVTQFTKSVTHDARAHRAAGAAGPPHSTGEADADAAQRAEALPTPRDDTDEGADAAGRAEGEGERDDARGDSGTPRRAGAWGAGSRGGAPPAGEESGREAGAQHPDRLRSKQQQQQQHAGGRAGASRAARPAEGRMQGAAIGLQRMLWPVESALAGGLVLRRGAAWLWTALISMVVGVLQNMVLCAPVVPIVLLGGMHQLRALSIERTLTVVALFVVALLGLFGAWLGRMPYAGRYLLFYVVVIFGGGGYTVLADKRLRRYARFLLWVLPIYVHYRGTQIYCRHWELEDEERQEMYDELHRLYAPRAYRAVVDLRGWFVKVGQIVSTFNVLMPKAYCTAFEPLQDGMPPRGKTAVRRMVVAALGDTPEKFFAEFDYKPLGAASIGQAHRARLHTGREVVVKVQYPEAQELFDLDFDCCIMFCRLAKPDYADTLQDMKNSVSGELDFRTEAANLARCAANLSRLPREHGAPRVAIPRPVPGMASEHVLVMDFFSGVKLIDGVKDHLAQIAKNMGMTLEELIEKGKDAMTAGGSEGSLSGGGAVGGITSRLGSSATVALILGLNRAYARTTNVFVNTGIALYSIATGTKAQYRKDLPAINPSALFEALVSVHGRQVLVDGLFNADPHPGNVLLMEGGSIGLIDYGQVKELRRGQRLALCRLVLAMGAGDSDAIVHAATELGVRTRHGDHKVILSHVLLRLDQGNEAIKGCNPQSLEKRDPLEECPEELNWVSRLSVILWGTGLVLGMRADLPKRWAPLAREALRAAEELDDAQLRSGVGTATPEQLPLAPHSSPHRQALRHGHEQSVGAIDRAPHSPPGSLERSASIPANWREAALDPLSPGEHMSGLLAGGGDWPMHDLESRGGAHAAAAGGSDSDTSGYASAEA